MKRSTDTLIRELGRGLAPVRPLPRLRSVVMVALVLAVPGWIWALARAGGARPDLLPLATGDLVFASIALGLTLVGAAATVGATALAVPGRAEGARRALAFAALGALLAFGIAPGWLGAAHPSAAHGPQASDLGCLIRGLGVSLASALATVAFVWRAAPRRVAWTAAIGAAAGTALGALSMHVTCPSPEPSHWLFGHAAAPLVAALATLPLVYTLSRLRRP